MSGIKFLRQFQLLVQTGQVDNQERQIFIQIQNPMTIEFDINKVIGSRFGSASITITNLSPKTRSQIFHSRYLLQDGGKGQYYKQIILKAGYGREGYAQFYTIFQGNILEADSYRNGTEVLTTIQAQDGLYSAVNAMSSYTFAAGTPAKNIFQSLATDLQNITNMSGTNILGIGSTSSITGNVTNNVTFSGNTLTVMQNYFGKNQQLFIDDERINLLNTNDVVTGDVTLINSNSGLLGTPRRQDTKLIADVVFQPDLKLGQTIAIQSSVQLEYNGQYKIIGLRHSGIISDAVVGDCKTEIQLLSGVPSLGGLNLIS